MRGKRVVVTGGRRGLGRAMVLGLADRGASVGVVARSHEADELRVEVEARGVDFVYESADLTSRTQRRGLVQRLAQQLGGVDAVINNAGVQTQADALEFPMESWDEALELHVTAVMDISRQAAKLMLAGRGGQIVNVASISSFQGARRISAYATAKHAVVGLTKCLANEWAGRGIRVNAVAPGLFDTDMASEVMKDDSKRTALLGRVPSARFGQPDDIVGPVVFLLSRAAEHVHGAVLLVDGGWMGR